MVKSGAERQRIYRSKNASYREREKLRNRKYRVNMKPKAKKNMQEKTRLRLERHRQKKKHMQATENQMESPYASQSAETRAVNRYCHHYININYIIIFFN